jgi:Ser/Thr protein kinase RdoA (MazF antagonist)
LRRMHSINAPGYGPFNNGGGRFTTIQDWLASLETRFAYTRDRQLLNQGEYGSIHEARETITAYAALNPSNSYCHNDFSAANLFFTSPITVFDPEPYVNSPLLDLAKSVVLVANARHPVNMKEAAKQLIAGYVGSGAPYDQKALRSAILLCAHLKFPFWDSTGQTSKLELTKRFLASSFEI